MNNKITFPRLATLLADRSGRSKRFSEDFLREFFALISERLEAQEIVKIKGFGTFRLTRVEPRRSVDVTTGEPMEISGHTKVVFIPSKELADAVNAPFEAFSTIEIADNVDIEELFSEEDINLESEEQGEKDDVLNLSHEELSEISNIPTEPRVVEAEINSGISDEPAEDLRKDTERETGQDDDEGNVSETESSEAYGESGVSDESVAPDELEEEFEEEISERRSRGKILLISLAAVVIAIFAGLAVWYVFAADNFNSFFNKYGLTVVAKNKTAVAEERKEAAEKTAAEKTVAVIDTLADSVRDNEPESEVPTKPSDAVVYDTISTTRYLTTMARAHYGNFNFWPYIYQENQSFLGHPDRIRPGTPVVIPKLSRYGVDPSNEADIEKAKKLGVEIYARYGKKI